MTLLVASWGCGDDPSQVPPPEPGWVKLESNPVLGGGLPESWDAYGAGSPCVRAEAESSLVMWYTGRDSMQTRIGRATSPDGIAWVKAPDAPLLGPSGAGSWDRLGVAHPCVLRDDSGYRMYYTGTGPGGSAIGLATSPDGIVWTPSSANPVLEPSAAGTAWDDDDVYTPWVLFDGRSYEMWYGARGTNGYRAVGHATSLDGTAWTRDLGSVLDPQVLEALTFEPCVLRAGGSYRMWYTALHETPAGGTFPGVIDFAQSQDGIDWTWHQLALSPGGAGSWDAGALRAACVLERGGFLQMWYEGVSAGGRTAIGLATLH